MTEEEFHPQSETEGGQFEDKQQPETAIPGSVPRKKGLRVQFLSSAARRKVNRSPSPTWPERPA